MGLAEEREMVLKVRLTPEDEAQIEEALRTARDPYDHEVAESARYLAPEDLLLVVLRSGQRLAIPVEDLQDLAGADRALVAKVELQGVPGWPTSLHWEALDVDFLVAGLAEGLYGSEWWMRSLSQRRLERLKAG